MSGTGLAPRDGAELGVSPSPFRQWIRAVDQGSTEGQVLVLSQRFLRQDDCVLVLVSLCGALVPVPGDAGGTDAEHQ